MICICVRVYSICMYVRAYVVCGGVKDDFTCISVHDMCLSIWDSMSRFRHVNRYRVATHRIPYLYRSFSAKATYI